MEIGSAPIEGSEQDEVARLRRLVRLQFAYFLSILVHMVLVVLLLLAPAAEKRWFRDEAPPKEKEPVKIAFIVPRPPPAAARRPPAPPQAQRPAMQIPLKPPPPEPQTKPYRMQPAPPQAPRRPPDALAKVDKPSGRNDTRPERGAAGGPLQDPAAGVPTPGKDEAANDGNGRAEPGRFGPPDLEGRLREFKRALDEARAAEPKGPKGGGQGTGGAQIPQLPGIGFGMGNLEFESRDYDWADYGRAVYLAILRAWYNRLYLTADVFDRWAAQRRDWEIDDHAQVRFTITRSGQIVDIVVEAASACEPLDLSATDALREVILPPLPDDFKRDRETVHGKFIITGDIRAMRSNLEWYKRYGFF